MGKLEKEKTLETISYIYNEHRPNIQTSNVMMMMMLIVMMMMTAK